MPTQLNVSFDARPPPDGLTDHQYNGEVSSATALKLPGDRLVSIWVVPVTAAGDGWVAAAGWETTSQWFLWAGPQAEEVRWPVQFDFTNLDPGVAAAAAVLVLQPHVNRTFLGPVEPTPPDIHNVAATDAIKTAFNEQNQFGGLSKALLYRA